MLLDAIYCALAGTVIAGGRHRVGEILGLHPRTTAAGGAATVAWSGALTVLSRHAHRRWPVAAVGVANAVAAAVLVTSGLRHAHRLARIVLVIGGLQVGAFAVSQALAVRNAARDPPQ